MNHTPFLDAAAIRSLQEEEAYSENPQKRTPEQIEAIYTHGQNVLVSASAGSGKTFVMVERIVDKLTRGVGIDALFISTFTVKAAGELKERIEKRLRQAIANSTDEALRNHLSQQLNNLDQAAIGTMDAFTQQLVSRYGYKLGISPHFRILTDKNEQDLIKHEVFADLFADYLGGRDAVVFRQLVRNFSGNRKDSTAFREVVYQIYAFSQATSHPKKWLLERFLLGYDRFRDLASIPEQMIADLLSQMLQAADQLQDVTDLPDYKQVTAKGTPTAAYQKHQAIYQGLRELVASFERSKDPTNLPQLLSQTANLLPAGSEVTVAGVKYPVFKGLQTQLGELRYVDTVLAYQEQARPLLEVLRAFVLDFSDQYFQAKMQENAYEFSDMSHLAIAILEGDEEVRTSLQERFHEVMVDEYQDNNHTQERMLDLLSNGHNRFMVGDVKQSIYRFRQADPQIFQSKFETYQANPAAGKLIVLKENFRSQIEVLEATNALFTRLMDKEIGQVDYNDQHCLVAGSPKQTIAQPHHVMEYLIYATDQESAADGEERMSQGEVELVAKEIIRLHQEEGIPFSEMTLLVPSRTRNDAIIQTFDRHGIPLVTDGGETTYLQSLEVMVLLDTLRTINNPLNDYALVAVLKSPMFGWQEDDLARIALQADSGLFYHKMEQAQAGRGAHPELVEEGLQERLTTFLTILASWRSYARLHRIHDLIWKIFRERLYYDYVGALPEGAKRQANLYALGIRATQFEQTGYKGLSRFIGMIDKVLASDNDLADVVTSPPKEAVQLMTIHKSKGLEFPYVFLLNMDKAFNALESRSPLILSRDNGIGIQFVADMKDQFETPLPRVRVAMNTLPYQVNQRELKRASLSEQMRLLYVAMTRAEKKLYLVGKGSREKLASRYDGKKEKGRLARETRQQLTSFQDWVLAIETAFSDQELHFKKTFVEDSDLTPDAIGCLAPNPTIQADDLRHNRQSEAISQALDQLKAVESLNQTYQAAINLPTLRTPSQIKKIYEPLLAEEGIAIMEVVDKPLAFSLPTFGVSDQVTASQVGSAVHELMQRIPLDRPVTKEQLERSLAAVQVNRAVKERVDLDKIAAFFTTELGRELLTHPDKVRREVPFASLEEDPVSRETFVLRGIIDGFLLYEDRIVLFDYKTDRYTRSSQVVDRYRMQMQLYAQALRRAYSIDQVESYLVLLGGDQVEIVVV